MPRYVRIQPKLYWDDNDTLLIPPIRVDAAEPQNTGLLDSKGNKLFKLPDVVGFLKIKDN